MCALQCERYSVCAVVCVCCSACCSMCVLVCVLQCTTLQTHYPLVVTTGRSARRETLRRVVRVCCNVCSPMCVCVTVRVFKCADSRYTTPAHHNRQERWARGTATSCSRETPLHFWFEKKHLSKVSSPLSLLCRMS